jgi:16S rRNA processing protein RimM
MNLDSMVTVGRIVRPHGHRGRVVVEPATDFAAERFAPGSEMWWRRGDAHSTVRVAESREFRGRWVVAFEGVATMNDAEALRGIELRIPAENLHELEPGYYYVHDLVGCRVVDVNGTELGSVTRVDIGAGTALLAIDRDRQHGGELLIPLAADVCREIDPVARRIVVRPPGGLLDLNAGGRRHDD